MDRARLWLGLLLPVVAALDFRYHHQEGMEAFLKSVAQNYSSITHLHSIGKSVRGRWLPAHIPNPQPAFKSKLNDSVWSPVGEALQTRSTQVKHTLPSQGFPAFVCCCLLVDFLFLFLFCFFNFVTSGER
jgi:hypothetical protein